MFQPLQYPRPDGLEMKHGEITTFTSPVILKEKRYLGKGDRVHSEAEMPIAARERNQRERDQHSDRLR